MKDVTETHHRDLYFLPKLLKKKPTSDIRCSENACYKYHKTYQKPIPKHMMRKHADHILVTAKFYSLTFTIGLPRL